MLVAGLSEGLHDVQQSLRGGHEARIDSVAVQETFALVKGEHLSRILHVLRAEREQLFAQTTVLDFDDIAMALFIVFVKGG